MANRGRLSFVGLGVVLMVLGLAGLWSSTAQAAPLAQADTGTISGHVTSLDNVPLSGVTVAAFTQPNTVQDRPAKVSPDPA